MIKHAATRDSGSVSLEWGHEILTPDGRVIRIPQHGFEKLRMLGLILKQRGERGLQQISLNVYEFLKPEYEALTCGLRALLGPDLTGPAIVTCGCRQCSSKHEDADRTPMPRPIPNWAQSASRH